MQDWLDRFLPLWAPDGDGGDPEETGGDDDGTAGDEGNLEPSGEEVDDTEPELEEFEFEGEKHPLPKSLAEKLKPAVLRNADYTQKTQALAAERRALEEARAAAAQEDKELALKRGQTAYAENMVRTYESLPWGELAAQDQDLYRQRQFELSEWRAALSKFKEDVTESEKKSQQAQSDLQTKRFEEAISTLQRDIPSWPKDGPKVGEFAVQQFGYAPREVLAYVQDPRFGKLLHAAWRGSQLEAAQKKAVAKKPAAEEVPPIVPATKVGRSASTSTRPSVRDDIDTWAAKRRKQIAARAN